MLTDHEIQKLKKDAERPNYGSRYASLPQMLAVIEAYETVKAERDALADQARSMFGYDIKQIWAEYQRLKSRLEAIERQFPAGQMEFWK